MEARVGGVRLEAWPGRHTQSAGARGCLTWQNASPPPNSPASMHARMHGRPYLAAQVRQVQAPTQPRPPASRRISPPAHAHALPAHAHALPAHALQPDISCQRRQLVGPTLPPPNSPEGLDACNGCPRCMQWLPSMHAMVALHRLLQGKQAHAPFANSAQVLVQIHFLPRQLPDPPRRTGTCLPPLGSPWCGSRCPPAARRRP